MNLRLVQRIVLNEIRTLYQVTSSLRSEIDNNYVLIKILEGSINEKLKNLQIETDHDLSLKNSEIITQLDARMRAIKKKWTPES